MCYLLTAHSIMLTPKNEGLIVGLCLCLAWVSRILPKTLPALIGYWWHVQVASSFAQMQRVTGEAVKAAAHDAIAEAIPRELAGPALKASLAPP